MKILIVEDNDLLGRSMRQGLEEAGFTVDLAKNGEDGIYCAKNSEYQILLVDRLLPKLSGMQVVASLRSSGSHVPVIMVTALGSVGDRVEGLEFGADDYLVKPFEMSELIARIKALHRRSVGRGDATVKFGALTINLEERWVQNGDTSLSLTSKEFDLLAALAARPGRVYSRTELLGLLYELNEEPESNSLDVLLARVRRKVAGAGVEIATVRGKGFVFRVETPIA